MIAQNWNDEEPKKKTLQEQTAEYFHVMKQGCSGVSVVCQKKICKGEDTKISFIELARIPNDNTTAISQLNNCLVGVRECYDCYISVNSFTGALNKKGYVARDNANCIFINAVPVDIDIQHTGDDYDADKGDAAISYTLSSLKRQIDHGNLPQPTIIVMSGRGLQLLYVYKEPLDAALWDNKLKHKALFSTISIRIQEMLGKDLADLDMGVGDLPRVFRIPGTWNTKAHRYAELLETNPDAKYSLNELCTFFRVEPNSSTEKKMQTKKDAKTPYKDTHAIIKSPALAPDELPVLKASLINDAKSRVSLMRTLASIRGMNEGNKREFLIFWFYSYCRHFNTAQAAMELTIEFNSIFNEPLPEAELNAAIMGTDSHTGSLLFPDGYYFCKRSTFAKMMQMTESEIEQTGIFKRKNEKEKQAKNVKWKKEIKQIAKEMRKNGATYQMIADETGMCKNTIKLWFRGTELSGHITKRDNFSENKEREERREGKISEETSNSLTDEPSIEDYIKLMNSGRNICITGGAGTGKSTLIETYAALAKKQKKKVLCLAPTNAAAARINGNTLHETFQIPCARILSPNEPISPTLLQKLKGIDIVIIDEIGNVRVDNFHWAVALIRATEKAYKKHIQVICSGDFNQLPPVLTKEEKEEFEELWKPYLGEAYKKAFAYEDTILWNKMNFIDIKLTKNYRALEDPALGILWEDVLACRPKSIFLLNGLVDTQKKYLEEDGVVHLCPYVWQVDDINHHIIENHPEAKCVNGLDFKAYIGMPVMLTEHLSSHFAKDRICKIAEIGTDYVRIDNKAGKARTLRRWKDKRIPLVPAFAITVHKAQGQTLDKVVIHSGFFEERHLYVAISRVRHMSDIFLAEKVTIKDLTGHYTQEHWEETEYER